MPLEVGQNIFIRGTGRWYHGSSYSAKVIDVRESDNTVKIRYLDGGYKRFKADELNQLIITNNVERNSVVDVLQAYELSHDQYDAGLSRLTKSINELDERINRAVSNREFALAQQLQEKLDEEVKVIQKIMNLREKSKRPLLREISKKPRKFRLNSMSLEKNQRRQIMKNRLKQSYPANIRWTGALS